MHIPVLQNEVLEFLNPKPNQNFVDCTVGTGGHALAILEENGPQGKVLGIDRDPELVQKLEHEVFQDRLITVCENFAHLEQIVTRLNFRPISGVLFDLGLCSYHLKESGRGFSFQKDEPLDMRYNPQTQQITAKDIINNKPQTEIKKILRSYGQEKFSKRIARAIVKARTEQEIKTSLQLVEIIRKAVPPDYRHGRIHWATRTFQALRIVVNNELKNLKKGLKGALKVLDQNGKIVVISFHSLEDRIVKNFFKEKAQQNLLKILTKKPAVPTAEEIKLNPSSRSAKLRASKKLASRQKK